ncbi:MAG: UDP-N-acetylmuramate:L-alanyl-gamma-D-glutamyl-meso-diaminopimelate ligase, partial [Candidatus Methylomirabilis sp.]|nr:UDP-N-acetylmuramate:L-alanyl-gamma-D-glutamyl-meso-diaminopimelate ligase [Deltaproteobacteria bacterium]
VIALLVGEGLSLEELRAGLRTFESVKRRQEVIAEEGGVVVIDDFAHHPTAVAVTLQGIRARYPGRRLLALFEPRTNTSRRAVFQEAYAGAFGAADVTIVAEVFKKEALGEGERFDSERLARDIAARGGVAMYVPRAEDILGWCRGGLRAGDVVVFMSNGDFGGLRAEIPRMLRARGEQAAQQQQ